jgi:hypothetical protein
MVRDICGLRGSRIPSIKMSNRFPQYRDPSLGSTPGAARVPGRNAKPELRTQAKQVARPRLSPCRFDWYQPNYDSTEAAANPELDYSGQEVGFLPHRLTNLLRFLV